MATTATAKRKIVIRTEHGTFTRTTARAYAFVVGVRGYRVDRLEQKRRDTRKSYQKQIAEYRRVVETGIVPADSAWCFTVDHYRKFLAETEQALAELDSAIDAEIARADADAAAPFAACSWSSRLDLARKQAERDREYYRDVRIFDVATGKEVR